jgi:hypothetical protein
MNNGSKYDIRAVFYWTKITYYLIKYRLRKKEKITVNRYDELIC